jgi:CHAT domain-containing protein/Tfp pilus assembly protein PilF
MQYRIPRTLTATILTVGLVRPTTAADRRDFPTEPPRPAVAVEEVGRGSALETAGLRPGDLLIAWERDPAPPANPQGAKGEIRTVFDWSWVATEQAPRGTVRLFGEREGVAIRFEVQRGAWDARMRPQMAAELLQTYTEGRRRLEAGDPEGGIALWNELVPRVEPELRCWLLLQVSDAWSKGKQGDKARGALRQALAEARDAQTQVALWAALGDSYRFANQTDRAEASLRSALEVDETAWGESLQVARTLDRLGLVLRLRSRPGEAAPLHRRALEIRQRLAPDSLEVADSFNQLAAMASARGDMAAVADYTQRALALYAKWSPDNIAAARTLNLVGILENDRGRFDEATAALQRALAIQEQKAPDSLEMATSLTNLGVVVRDRGDLDAAEELLQRALAIRERLAPDSLGTAAISTSLGVIAEERGDLAAAAELYQRAMEIWAKAAPEGPGVAENQDLLGNIARLRGDLNKAWDLHRRALGIHERLAPGSLDMARGLDRLGRVAEARGDLSLALDFHLRAHAIYARLAPGTIVEALSLEELGRLNRRSRRPEQAAQLLAQAVDTLESHMGKIGGTQDLQANFRARYEDVYREAIDLEVVRGNTAAAFHLLERSRARSFLSLLAERDLEFSSELPAVLERSRRDNAALYDQTLRELSRWTPATGEEARERILRELGRLRRERDVIHADIRKASPRLAALRQPQPLDLAAARQVLDSGTLALSYSVGEKQTALFALTRDGGLRVKVLPVAEERLRQDIERFLEKVRQPIADAETADLARALYRTLIGPVADLAGKSRRILILPDGPLHHLPFGALRRDAGGRRQYLAEWKPVHTALSLTVYGALRAARGEPAPESLRLVAFGDPRYPKDLTQTAETRDPLRRALGGLRSLHWAPLPYSRREVERIAAAYPAARLYLGDEATEERAKAVATATRVLHFATHAYLDDRTPLDSALVLTLPEEVAPGRDNGLLQVWEIFERVRLDADLVVLSACDSALGRELSGEGMIGLTRAFQYAGARSVVATLWSVSDQATAELMARFHRHYAAGIPKDEALRRAQIELIRQPIRITTANGQRVELRASAPFFWAAFQLFGDWR